MKDPSVRANYEHTHTVERERECTCRWGVSTEKIHRLADISCKHCTNQNTLVYTQTELLNFSRRNLLNACVEMVYYTVLYLIYT